MRIKPRKRLEREKMAFHQGKCHIEAFSIEEISTYTRTQQTKLSLMRNVQLEKMSPLHNPTALAKHLTLSLCLSVWSSSITAQPLSEVEQGLRIMANRQQGNCITCHQVTVLRDAKGIDGASGKQGDFGPSLDGVGKRYSLAQLRQWVMDGRRFNPNTLMPPFGTIDGASYASPSRPILSLEEIDKVTAALATLR